MAQLRDAASVLGLSVATVTRVAAAEGAAAILARHEGGGRAGAAGGPSGPPMHASSLVLLKKEEDDACGGRAGAGRGLPPLDSKDAAGWVAADLLDAPQRPAACRKNAAHGPLVLRWNPKKSTWFLGCGTFAETECKEGWSPRNQQVKDGAKRDSDEAARKAEEREAFARQQLPGPVLSALKKIGGGA